MAFALNIPRKMRFTLLFFFLFCLGRKKRKKETQNR